MAKLRENYVLANCCLPKPNDRVIGYHSHSNVVKVHRVACTNLGKAEPARLVQLDWTEIIEGEEFVPDRDFDELIELDFDILGHHKEFGFDYSNMVAVMLKVDRKSVFDRHKYLKDAKLLERVAPKMIQYRKNIVKNKWIKHRNHTYYDITSRGLNYLKYHLAKK